MQLFPGDRIELDGGSSADVVTRLEPVVPGVVACEVLVAGAQMLALLEDPRAPEDMRRGVSALLRRMRPRAPGAFGPDLAAQRVVAPEQLVGYRDAAGSHERDSKPVVFFSLSPTMLFARMFTPTLRIDWPAGVVARLAVELAASMARELPPRIDPFSVGLSPEGAWLLDPALDALLRPEVRDGGGLRGAVAWMGYLAPESIRGRASGERAPPHAAALHGLGVLLHELLMGEALYGGETPLETLIALRRGLPPSLSQSIPDIPPDLAAVVHALLDHDPFRRPEPRLVIQTLAPLAAPDLSWTEPLRVRHARPLDFLRTALRRER